METFNLENPMQLSEVILAALASTIVVNAILAGIGYMVRIPIQHWLIDRLKIDQQKQLEQFKQKLIDDSANRQLRYSTQYEKAARAAADMYQILNKLSMKLALYVHAYQRGEDLDKYGSELTEVYEIFSEQLNCNGIYFPASIENALISLDDLVIKETVSILVATKSAELEDKSEEKLLTTSTVSRIRSDVLPLVTKNQITFPETSWHR